MPQYADVRDRNERVEHYLNPTIFWQLTAARNDVIRAATKDIRAFIDESVTKFFIGSKPLDEWDSYVATIEDEAGAEIQAAIEVRQAYFDQHLRASYQGAARRERIDLSRPVENGSRRSAR